jgi:thiol-disulfide isomerase/thioredoxin
MALVTWAVIVLVLVVVVALLVFKVSRGNTPKAVVRVTPAPAQVVQEAASIPALVFNTVGTSAPDGPVPVVLNGQPPLVSNGRPEVVYVGSEFCPYCAAVRWALVVALSRFGTFGHLGQTRSSPAEVFPGLQTFTFDGAAFHSRYLSWSAVEEYGPSLDTTVPAGFPTLHRPSPEVRALLARYAGAGNGGGSLDGATLPFVDIGNRVLIEGAGIGFSPGAIQGMSMDQIAADLSQPTSPVAEAVVGAANEITAAVCASTGETPAKVCRSAGARAGTARLGL